MNKLLITGGTGLLGSTLLEHKSKVIHEIKSLDRKYYRAPINEIDLTNEIRKISPTIVIHCAAITNVEWCENNVFDCFDVNTNLTSIFAKICFNLNIKFVFISSTGIYGDWKDLPYTESDEVIPTTVHHRSKFKAEQSVQKLLNDSLIIRTGWIFGGCTKNSKNFVVNRAKEINEAKNKGNVLYANDAQVGNPTYVDDLADRIILLIKDNVSGIFNCVNQGHATRLEYVEAIARAMKVDVDIQNREFHRVAQVSKNESAINVKMLKMGYEDLPFWVDSLQVYIQKIDLSVQGS